MYVAHNTYIPYLSGYYWNHKSKQLGSLSPHTTTKNDFLHLGCTHLVPHVFSYTLQYLVECPEKSTSSSSPYLFRVSDEEEMYLLGLQHILTESIRVELSAKVITFFYNISKLLKDYILTSQLSVGFNMDLRYLMATGKCNCLLSPISEI